MAETDPAAFDENFWDKLQRRLCEHVATIDRRVDELHAERDRVTAFLKDHGRSCN